MVGLISNNMNVAHAMPTLARTQYAFEKIG